MRRYILAFLAALVLVVGAYVVNTSGTDPSTQQPRVLPDIKRLQLR